MKAFTLIQHVLTALYLGLMALVWGVPIAPALFVFNELNSLELGNGLWIGYLVTGISAAFAFMTWGFSLLLFSGLLQAIIHPRVGAEGKVVPLFSATTVGWASCAMLHKSVQPFLNLVCPSMFANMYYRLAGVKLGSDINITSDSINDPSLVRIGSGTVVGGNAAINGHIVEKGQLVLAPVVIGDNCVVGGGSIMMPGSKLGNNSVLGNRALLPKYREVPDGEVWAGIPAAQISVRSSRD